jgi:hypothetical protein
MVQGQMARALDFDSVEPRSVARDRGPTTATHCVNVAQTTAETVHPIVSVGLAWHVYSFFFVQTDAAGQIQRRAFVLGQLDVLRRMHQDMLTESTSDASTLDAELGLLDDDDQLDSDRDTADLEAEVDARQRFGAGCWRAARAMS